ncbi:hypothetical protein AB4441_25210, partial [Vibrio splendidus]
TLDLGFESRAAKDVANLDTRKSKTYESEATLNAHWQQTVRNAGHKPEELVKNALGITPQEQNPEEIAKDAFGRAVEHLGQYNTALKLEKVIELVAAEFTKGG